MGISKHSAGFTIIEVVLFLAVSGALAAGVFATSTVGINNQRYQDAVNSFTALIQGEFINTTRVVNAREGQAPCPLDSTVGQRGTTDCVVMGRLMSVNASGQVTLSNLIGKSNGTSPTLDTQVIKSFTPKIDTNSQQTSTLSWGTTPSRGNTPRPVSIAIFRSPLTGNVLAFVQDNTEISTDGQLTNFVNSSAFRNDETHVICIASSGWTVAQSQVVLIAPYAAGPSSVEQRLEQGAECA
jgi:type II secretory pathway pseudopilin PulG